MDATNTTTADITVKESPSPRPGSRLDQKSVLTRVSDLKAWSQVFFASVLFLSSLSLFGAYYNRTIAARMIKPWLGQSWQDSVQNWDVARSRLDKARLLNPWDHEALLLRAELYFSQARAQRLYRKEAQRNWRIGLDNLRDALSASPANALVWSKFALAKLQAGQLDKEFDLAVGSALKYGHWDPDTQFHVVVAGMAGWQTLSVNNKESFKHAIREVMRKPSMELEHHVRVTAKNTGWEPMLHELTNIKPDT